MYLSMEREFKVIIYKFHKWPLRMEFEVQYNFEY